MLALRTVNHMRRLAAQFDGLSTDFGFALLAAAVTRAAVECRMNVECFIIVVGLPTIRSYFRTWTRWRVGDCRLAVGVYGGDPIESQKKNNNNKKSENKHNKTFARKLLGNRKFNAPASSRVQKKNVVAFVGAYSAVHVYIHTFLWEHGFVGCTYQATHRCDMSAGPVCPLHNEATKGWHSAVPLTTMTVPWRHVAADHDYYSSYNCMYTYNINIHGYGNRKHVIARGQRSATLSFAFLFRQKSEKYLYKFITLRQRNHAAAALICVHQLLAGVYCSRSLTLCEGVEIE